MLTIEWLHQEEEEPTGDMRKSGPVFLVFLRRAVSAHQLQRGREVLVSGLQNP